VRGVAINWINHEILKIDIFRVRELSSASEWVHRSESDISSVFLWSTPKRSLISNKQASFGINTRAINYCANNELSVPSVMAASTSSQLFSCCETGNKHFHLMGHRQANLWKFHNVVEASRGGWHQAPNTFGQRWTAKNAHAWPLRFTKPHITTPTIVHPSFRIAMSAITAINRHPVDPWCSTGRRPKSFYVIQVIAMAAFLFGPR